MKKSNILISTLVLFCTTVSAWGTVKLSIAPSLVNITAFNRQPLNLHDAISELCTNGPSTVDTTTGLLWHHCVGDILAISNGLAVRVDKAAWRDDNAVLRNTMITAVSEAYDALRSSTTLAGYMASKLHLDTGLQGENMLHVSLLSHKYVAMPEQCFAMIPYATKAIDKIMMTFGEQLGRGSTTRVVQCVDAHNNELPPPSVQEPASVAVTSAASRVDFARTMAFLGLSTLLASAWLWL